jgi:energy-coupling factor transporter ATP-binding protein EcfA2
MIALATHLLVLSGATCVTIGAAQLSVWAAHRYSLLSVFNLYPLLALCGIGALGAAALHVHDVLVGFVIVAIALVSATVSETRRRHQALNAGGELRAHELTRRWVLSPAPRRAPGERVHLGRQGEVVRVKPWSRELPFVAMADDHGSAGARLPLGEGQHIFLVGATGAGKTTTARRVIAARVLSQRSSLVILDQKGDPADVLEMRRLAAAAGVPFVLFDAEDPNTDRWQPLWGSADKVAARVTEAIKESEPYYYEVLRKHLDIVCKVLHAADHWPPSVPYLIDACETENFTAIQAIAENLATEHHALQRRVARHSRWVNSRKGVDDLSGAVLRIENALGLATTRLITPRLTPTAEAVAVRLVDALRKRAVVMWRTHADTMPDTAASLTAVALADLHDAAEHDVGQWTLLLDEFGAVIETNAHRALAILQRGRSHHGQAVVITQSVADIEALTGTPGLLDSLTDNFAAIVAHRQSSPDSRDWLARLMGTRELWQSTNQTDGHGTRLSGRGSSRRVHEFRIPPDSFATLSRGEAVIYTPEGLQAQRTQITPVSLPADEPTRIDLAGERDQVEIAVHPEEILTASHRARTPDHDDGSSIDTSHENDTSDEPGGNTRGSDAFEDI